ncbi:MAG: TSCPD domain-containing protein [Bacteroidetes bacterium]|nr:TSCPD domain-containing protein [Bacteroidota bacterium]
MVKASNHTGYQTRPEIIDLLAPLNFDGNTKAEIIERLKGIRIGDIPTSRRKAILDRLEAIGITKQQIAARITLDDTLLKVLRLLLEYFRNDGDTMTADDEIEKGYL